MSGTDIGVFYQFCEYVRARRRVPRGGGVGMLCVYLSVADEIF